MLNAIDEYFNQQEEPAKGVLLFLRNHILNFQLEITEVWRYKMPFYCYQGHRFCYLWVDKKTRQPYLGLVDGMRISNPLLVAGNRSRMKILMLDSNKNLPIKDINAILLDALKLISKK